MSIIGGPTFAASDEAWGGDFSQMKVRGGHEEPYLQRLRENLAIIPTSHGIRPLV